RPCREGSEPSGYHHLCRRGQLAAGECKAKPAVMSVDPLDPARVDIWRDLLLHPKAIIDETFDWKRRGNCLAADCFERPQAEHVVWIGDVRSHVRRAQEHSGRHAALPERHRLADHRRRWLEPPDM